MNRNDTRMLINESVRNLDAYHLEPKDVPVKLNQNENPFDWPIAIKQEIIQFFVNRPWNRYPHFIPDELKNLLGQHVGLDKSNVIVGNGSNEMLLVLMMSLLREQSKVIICEPTFTVYRLLATGKGAVCISVNLTNELQFDTDALLDSIAQNPGAMLILCSPNNPTGSSLSEQQIRLLLNSHAGFCILDQAYIEFGGFNAIPLLKEYPNLIITRTFSKAFAGAGLRIGYMLGDREIIAEINKIKLPYNINFFTEHAAKILLKNYNAIKEGLSTILSERESMFEFLKTMPFDIVYPSTSNFFCIRTSHKDHLLKALLDDGILVRDVSSNPMLANCFRVNIGTPDENDQFKKSTKQYFNK